MVDIGFQIIIWVMVAWAILEMGYAIFQLLRHRQRARRRAQRWPNRRPSTPAELAMAADAAIIQSPGEWPVIPLHIKTRFIEPPMFATIATRDLHPYGPIVITIENDNSSIKMMYPDLFTLVHEWTVDK